MEFFYKDSWVRVGHLSMNSVLLKYTYIPSGTTNLLAVQEMCRRHGFNPWVSKIPWNKAWQPIQYSCWENPVDIGAWQAMVHRVAKSQTLLKGLNTHTRAHTHTHTHLDTDIYQDPPLNQVCFSRVA